MAHDFYICYSTVDREIAENVCKSIESDGFKCWIAPRNVSGGMAFREEIVKAIKDCKCFVLIFSKDSQESRYVLGEVDAAFSNNILTVVFNIDGTIPNDQFTFYLNHLEFINAQSGPMNENINKLMFLLAKISGKGLYKPPNPQTGIHKRGRLPEGINKRKTNFFGKHKRETQKSHSIDPYIYLSYDDADSDFISSQIKQFKSQGVNFTHNDIKKIDDASLLVIFISIRSHKSSQIREDVIKAISNSVSIMAVYLEDIDISFGRIFKFRHESKFRNAIKYSIARYELDELAYIDRYNEIFQLYGTKYDVNEEAAKRLKALSQSEEFIFEHEINLIGPSMSIDLDSDGVVIDGQGHSITASGLNHVFNITGRNVTLKNINFRDCRLKDSSTIIAISEDSSVVIDCCYFKSNESDGNLVSANGKTIIKDTGFESNRSKKSLVFSDGNLIFESSEFVENITEEGCMSNEGELMVSNSKFEANKLTGNACAICNAGTLKCYESAFLRNLSESNLISNENFCCIGGCIFKGNRLDVIVSNRERLDISKSEFTENEVTGTNIYSSGDCKMISVIFDSNRIEQGFEIYNEGQMSLKKMRLTGEIFNSGKIIADKSYDETVDITTIADGMDKPFAETIGIAKPEMPLSGGTDESFSIYLCFDDADSQFVQSQIDFYLNQEINISSNIEYSSLAVAFISKDSYQSLKIADEIKRAVSFDRRLLFIYLDDVDCAFEDEYKDFIVYSLNRFEMGELEYIERCSEIFNLFGLKREKDSEPIPKSLPQMQPADNALTFEDLDSLIQADNEIILTGDVQLFESEAQKYKNGIELCRDGIVIEGRGHSISANDLSKIFNIKSRGVTFRNLNFTNCRLKGDSSIMDVSEGSSVTIENCSFTLNDLDDGHAIYTEGDIKITDSKFEANTSENEGPAIYARGGKLEISNAKFIENRSRNSGGAILNWANLNIADSIFKGNFAEGYGGAIGNVIDAVLTVSSTQFVKNTAISDASAIYNENVASCSLCDFENHTSRLSVIFNENTFDLFNCNFKNNSSRIIVQNNENGILNLSNSKMIENDVIIANVYNNGEKASLEKVKFKDCKSVNPKSESIYNETYMQLRQPKLECHTILNTGHMDIWDYDAGLINNESTVSVMDGPCDREYGFAWLDEKITKSEDDIIMLENNVKLENCELEFYEGGIELARDNLTIDGQGHYIDGARRTAILRVAGKNITLKNIIFKNANLVNDFESHTTGGSAIRTLKGSSLNVVGCEFENNLCDDDGGAILNRSNLTVRDSIFKNNSSMCFAGAICNKATLTLHDNEFKHNKSKICENILNAGKLEGNFSDEDVHDISTKNDESDSYSLLSSRIRETCEIILRKDVRFDYKEDMDFKNGIPITDAESLTIDGRGHQVSGDERASLFTIKNSRVIFKNIVFCNAYSYKSPIFENEAEIEFENCTFIDNHATFDNTLITNNGTVKLKGCRFIKNVSKNRSLILNGSRLEIEECRFSLHSNEKPIISNRGDIRIINSEFSNNHANENAAAIINKKNGKIFLSNTSFKSNSTSKSGGAIMNEGSAKFERCEFKSNFSRGDGGALNNEKNAELEMIASNVIDNTSKGDGGAVINWGKLAFKNTYFTDNTAGKDGGIVNVQKGSLAIDSCSADRNSAFDGGAIFNRGDLDISNSRFEQNTAKKDGGAVNSYDGKIRMSNSLIKANNAADGGAMYARKGDVHVRDTEFDSNSADINGGAIIKWCEMTIENSRLFNNSAAIYGGAINNQKDSLTIVNSELTSNRADTGGAVFNVDADNFKISDCRLEDNSPEDIF